MKCHYLAGILLACSINTASAAVNFFTAPTNWTGAYAGLQGGYGWGHARWEFTFPQYYNFPDRDLAFSTRPTGGLGGVQIGYLYQYQWVVAGLEFGYLHGNLNRNNIGAITPTFPDDVYSTSVENLRSFTGRLGIANYCWQIYAKGGYADAKTTIEAFSGDPGAGVVGEGGRNQRGWTAGAGVDYRLAILSPNIFVGLEYDYVKLRDRTFRNTTTGTLPGLPFEVRMHNVSANMVTAHANVTFF